MLSDCRILVVDDDVLTAEVVAEFLLLEGYTASRATSGAEAVRLATQQPPDLILLDWWLPGSRWGRRRDCPAHVGAIRGTPIDPAWQACLSAALRTCEREPHQPMRCRFELPD